MKINIKKCTQTMNKCLDSSSALSIYLYLESYPQKNSFVSGFLKEGLWLARRITRIQKKRSNELWLCGIIDREIKIRDISYLINMLNPKSCLGSEKNPPYLFLITSQNAI